jgi:hypothetical protein
MSPRWDDVLYEIALALGLNPDYELFAGPVDSDEVFAALPGLERWRGFVKTHYGLVDIENPQPATDEDAEAPSVVEIGCTPMARASKQTSLSRANSR